jgi:hypothetical protein
MAIPIYVKAAITRFDKSARDYAFKGAQPPDRHEEIEARYRNARTSLELSIELSIKRALNAEVSR